MAISQHSEAEQPLDQSADRTRELMVLNAIAAAVAASLEPEPLLASALDHVLDLLAFDAGAIFTRESDRLRLMVHRGIPTESLDDMSVLRLDPPLVARLVGEQRPAAMHDLSDAELFWPIARQSGYQSLLALPLFARADVAGVLLVLRQSANGFSDRERRLLEASADHIALALDNARLFVAEQQRRKQAEALRRGALALTEALDPEEVLARIVEQATELMESPLCAIYEIDEDSGHFSARRGTLEHCDRPDDVEPLSIGEQQSVRVGQQLVSAAIAAQRAVYLPDLHDPAERVRYGLGDLGVIDSRVQGVIAAPLLVKKRAYGGLVVYAMAQHHMRDEEIQLLDIFADQAALALEHARLIDRSRQLAALEERQRIARDLHDSVSQTLFSLRLSAQAARMTVESDVAAATAMLDTVQELASGALAEMRALIFELRPGALHEAGLAAAIERFVDAFRSRTGLRVTLSLAIERLPLPIEEALYRIACEALNNISKHADAEEASVTLSHSDGTVRLMVQDDGVGFPVNQPIVGDHIGHRTMQERAAALGGSFAIESAPGQGTRVRVEIPVMHGEYHGSDQSTAG